MRSKNSITANEVIIYANRGRTEPGWTDTFYLGAYRREVFDRIGGFDEEMVRNQDGEFNSRLIQAGGKIWLEPSIRSVYHGRSHLDGLRRQNFPYGFYRGDHSYENSEHGT